jgi:hypothetical protein
MEGLGSLRPGPGTKAGDTEGVEMPTPYHAARPDPLGEG